MQSEADEAVGVALEETPAEAEDETVSALDEPEEVEPAAEPEAAPEVVTSRTTYRLRDLDTRGRLVAAVFAVTLALAPVLAFAQTQPKWTASGDVALMALRTLDVGTSRTPVSGQPSTSGTYVDDVPEVMHPGPLHFYLMAGPVRLIGLDTGMLLISLLITGGAVWLAAWAVFRQLGPPGGVVAALVLATITFTTGASSLMNPVSSNIAGYPLLLSMVLLWCLLCGDLRLLPLAAVVVSFAAQQHLSSGPTLAVAVLIVGLALLPRLVRGWRRPETRKQLVRWGGWAAGLSLVLWTPVIVQQVFGNTGNITALIEFTQSDDRPTVGFDRGIWQVVHTLGWRPAIGQTELDGHWFLREPSATMWVSAGVVLALTVLVGVWARRTGAPRRAALMTMTAVLVVAGLMNGSSVPEGIEQGRLPFYHWVWPLSFFVVTGLALALVTWIRRADLSGRRWLSPAVLSVSLVAMVVPAAMSPSMDRRSNELRLTGTPVERRYIDGVADDVMAHGDAVHEPIVIVERGRVLFQGIGLALSLELIERGVDVRFSPGLRQGVHADRMSSRQTVQGGLAVIITDGVDDYPHDVPGELVSTFATTGIDLEAYTELITEIREADEIVLDPALVEELSSRSLEEQVLLGEIFNNFKEHADGALKGDPTVMQMLLDYPLIEPRLDPVMIRRLMASVGQAEPGHAVQVYLLDREEMLDYALQSEVGRIRD